ncbi:MAG: hypothetical protein ACJ0QJ_01155 [Flavobacteriales bacterium]
MRDRKINFGKEPIGNFTHVLKTRVNAYFEEAQLTKQGGVFDDT